MNLTLRESMLTFKRAPLLSALSVTTIAFSLFVLGLFGLVVVNLQAALRDVEERVEIVAYLLPGAPVEASAQALTDIEAFQAGARGQPASRVDRGEAQAGLSRRRSRRRGRRSAARLRLRGRRALRARLGGEARPPARTRRRGRHRGRRGVRDRGYHHHRHDDPHGRAAAEPRDRDHAPRRCDRRLHPAALPAPGGHQGTARRRRRDRVVVCRLHADQSLPAPSLVLHAGTSRGHRRLRRAHWIVRQRLECGTAPEANMRCAVLLLLAIAAPLAAQRPTYQQQMQENQRRRESIKRERSEVESELERLRTQAHSRSDEIANIEQQKQSTNRIVNELDRQIRGLGTQIDQITVDLLIAQDALLEKRAVLERRLVDIYKRGPLYSWQVLLAAESFGDLLSRYKYLFLVSRQDRLLTNDMQKLRDRVARQRQLLVDSREALAHRKVERTDELGRYLALEHERETNLRETRRNAREAEQRLTRLDRDERALNDRVEALERARREAESRGVATDR